MLPLVTVIIPCRNEAASVGRALRSVLASHYPPGRMEVIAVDGLSTDGTRQILDGMARGEPRLRVLSNPDRITPIALNRAIRAARGSLLLRVDAHSTVGPDYVRELVAFLDTHPEAWGAGGAMHTVPELASRDSAFAGAVTLALTHPFGVGNSRFRIGAGQAPERVDTVFNCCWRRAVFARAGLFHESLARSQDIEMSQRIARAGGSLYLVPTAHTTYFARARLGTFLRHNFQNGVWSIVPAIYLGRLPVGWRHLVPMAFVASLAVASLAALCEPTLRALPLLPVAPYAAVNLASSLHAAVRSRAPRLAIFAPVAFAALHLAYGAGSLWGALRLLAHHIGPRRERQPAPVFDSAPDSPSQTSLSQIPFSQSS